MCETYQRHVFTCHRIDLRNNLLTLFILQSREYYLILLSFVGRNSLMNMAILLRGLPPDAVGGMETQTDQMATHLRDCGHEVCVITKAGSGDAPDRPYDVLHLPHLRWHPMLSDLSFLIGALLVLLRHHACFDVLQCMMLYPMGAVGTVVHRLTGSVHASRRRSRPPRRCGRTP